eukprot:CAMPEP_0119547830 /NCGR_PEP_ID=MMETSP1352-20130426/1871_1 /TAXON_ID=265584 /ORGANISM="Stauroneis constricta, Strain CCMP1120" /LENGTH=1133 /DNA_ID=CAMNT_0007592881 /DNA_START=9 /DNA_END=3407 /DNA_ORIENTATION=-
MTISDSGARLSPPQQHQQQHHPLVADMVTAMKNDNGPGESAAASQNKESIGMVDDSHRREEGTPPMIMTGKKKLSFHTIGLIGRDNEMKLLRRVIHQHRPNQETEKHALPSDHDDVAGRDETESSGTSLASSNASSSRLRPTPAARTLVLISGQSGSGKSSLIAHLQKEATMKTTATEAASSPIDAEFQGFFVQGKCEMSQKHDVLPYAGIQAAMVELCNQINELEQRNRASSLEAIPPQTSFHQRQRAQRLHALLHKGLSDIEVELLSNVIPNIRTIVQPRALPSSSKSCPSVSSTTPDDLSASVTRNGNDNGAPKSAVVGIEFRKHTDRLKFALRRFVQIVSNYCPVVIVMDNLQWADRESLGLMQSWLSDTKNAALTIIGLYRTNMLDENQILKAMLVSLDESKRERSIRVVKLAIHDFDEGQVAEYLSRLLAEPVQSEELQDLAQLVHRKTGGNALFIKELMESLVDEELLVYKAHQGGIGKPSDTCTTLLRWTWDVDEINAKNSALTSSNIMDLMANKLQQSETARLLLPVAACLGASFSVAHLKLVLKGLCIHSEHSSFFRALFHIKGFLSGDDVVSMIIKCCDEGYIEPVLAHSSGAASVSTSSESGGSVHHRRRRRPTVASEYCFVHDKVQEVSFQLIENESDRTELRYRVGKVLLYNLQGEHLEDKIFVVTNLLNTRLDLVPSSQHVQRRMRLAGLNHKAGLQAAQCSAFHLASTYFKTAIGLLPDNHFEESLQQSIEMYSSAAESCFVTCDFEKAKEYCNAVISQRCAVLKKVRAYHVLIDVNVAETQIDEQSDATAIGLDLLSQLGCNMPTSKRKQNWSTMKSIVQAKRLSKRIDDNFLSTLPHSDDEIHHAIMRTLGKLITTSYLSNPELLPCIAYKVMKRTLTYGSTADSAVALSLQGLILGSVLGDLEGGQRFGKLSLQMAQESDDRTVDSRVLYTVHGCVLHWNQRMELSLDPLYESYKLGMSCGDVEAGTWGIAIYLWAQFFTGQSLSVLDDELSTYTKVLLDFHQTKQHQTVSMHWQTVMNLRGASISRLDLIGDAYDERKDSGEPTTTHKIAKCSNKVILAAIFGENEFGADIIIDIYDDMLKKNPGYLANPSSLLYGGLCCFAVARSRMDRKIL